MVKNSPSIAALVYVRPKIRSNYTVWCLEPIDGAPALAHLLRRLKRGLAAELEVFVAPDGEVAAERMAAHNEILGASLVTSAGAGKLAVLQEFLKSHPSIRTLLIFPENAIF